MHRGPGGETPVIDGTIGRSEFGVEIFVAVGFLTYVAGMSIDKVCGILEFFWKLKLPKSQADALLNRLGTEWEPVFDDLCELLANATVVHADETSWSINSVWAFISSQARLLIYGVRKDAHTLLKISRFNNQPQNESHQQNNLRSTSPNNNRECFGITPSKPEAIHSGFDHHRDQDLADKWRDSISPVAHQARPSATQLQQTRHAVSCRLNEVDGPLVKQRDGSTKPKKIAWTGVHSNCMSCHRMAGYNTSGYQPDGFISSANGALFGKGTKTDFWWSIPTRAR